MDVDLYILGDFNMGGVCCCTRCIGLKVEFYARDKAKSIFSFIELLNLDGFYYDSLHAFFLNNRLDLVMMNCNASMQVVKALVPSHKFHAPLLVSVSDDAMVKVKKNQTF